MRLSPVISDKNVLRFYAAAWVILYLITYFFLKNFLPEEYFRDSLVIQRLAMTGNGEQWGGAYGIAAFMTRVLSTTGTTILVAAMGSAVICYIIMSLKTIRGMILIVPVLGPFIILNIMDFGKESFVIPLTFIILQIALKSRSTIHAIITIFIVYLLYGLFFREYYLIILAAFVCCIIFRKASLPFRILYLLLFVCILFVIPSKFFITLQGDRDRINEVANLYFNRVHTAIYNPLPPDNGFNFIVNYLYAFARLNLAFIFRFSANEIILLFDSVIFFRLAYTTLKKPGINEATLLPLLFVAHLLVLYIFEPDVGSYLRHASSVFLYLLPSLGLAEQNYINRYLDTQRRKTGEKTGPYLGTDRRKMQAAYEGLDRRNN